MKRIGILILVLFAAGCSNDDEMEQLVTKYENKIEEQQKDIENQQKEIKELKEEIEELKFVPDVSYRSSLQVADREVRGIMRFILEGKFEEIKKEHDVQFEVKDGSIHFGEPEHNLPFPIEFAGNFMHIGNFIKHPDGRMEIAYFVDDPKNDRAQLINISFDNDMRLKYIFIGEA